MYYIVYCSQEALSGEPVAGNLQSVTYSAGVASCGDYSRRQSGSNSAIFADRVLRESTRARHQQSNALYT
jgi:hypothetical protein